MKRGFGSILILAVAAAFVYAQDAPQQPDPGGWRRIGGNQAPALQTAPQAPAPAPPAQSYSYNLPSTLTVKPGTFIIVRLNQALSSDHNHQGDGFTGTLEQPIVVDGIAVAQRGQLVAGVVTEATPARRGENVSHLWIGLTNLTLADGNQVNIQSTLVTSSGPGWSAPDTAAVAGTGAFGAAIGAIAGGGTGAAIGAGAGAFAALAGLLMTHGHPTILTPESILTFRITNEVAVNTDRSPQSFRPAEQTGPPDNGQGPQLVRRGPAPGYPGPGYAVAPGYPPPAPYYGYPYPYAYPYPYYYGPNVVIGVGGYGYYRGGYGYYRR